MNEIQKINESTMVSGDHLYEFSRELIINSRRLVYQTANFAMVETYWRIGEKIVEEQGGETYAKYGESLLKNVSARLRAEFGQGFTYVNLTNMRKFYQQFPNVYALRKELSWTHYRSLIRVENPKAREVYMNEAADNGWSTRFLDEQVDKHYYERLIATHKESINELNEKTRSSCRSIRRITSSKTHSCWIFMNSAKTQNTLKTTLSRSSLAICRNSCLNWAKDFRLSLVNSGSRQNFRTTILTWFFTIIF